MRGFLAGATILAIAVVILIPLREYVNVATIALALLIVVLLIATSFGSFPALAISVIAMMCFNFFFIPPYYTLTVQDPQNWVALAAFLLTAVIAGGLSARERERTEEAQRLYVELQKAFEKASEAEALKQSEQMKSGLLDAVTHDLRTPLTSMKAAVTAMLSGPQVGGELDEEGQRELLEVIDAEIDRMNRLIEGMIQMARIEAGAMDPRRSWCNMEEVIANALTRSAGITTKHQIRTQLESDLPFIRLDEKAIAEVLYILIENATKFSPPATEIMISVSKKETDIIVSVQDVGAGIPKQFREKVFDKFFRIPDTISGPVSRPAGLGMGLSIARAIVEAHGGKIWIDEPADSVGTRISFSIPVSKERAMVRK
jgi:two-component system sensor histidine kinase KdpD